MYLLKPNTLCEGHTCLSCYCIKNVLSRQFGVSSKVVVLTASSSCSFRVKISTL